MSSAFEALLAVGAIAVLALLPVAAAAQSPGTAADAPAARAPIGPVPGTARGPQRPQNPYAGDEQALREGKRLFAAFNCGGCHGPHGGGGMGPSLRDEVWIYGSDGAAVYSSIALGRANGMPAWGSLLPEPEIWKLAAYIGSLRTPQEPDPPRQ